MPPWLDQFLKDGPVLPETPAADLVLRAADGATSEFQWIEWR